MAKLTRTEIKSKADEWAVIKKKLKKAEDLKRADMAGFDAAIKAVSEIHDPHIQLLRTQADKIEAEVIAAVTAIDKPVVITSEKAIASAIEKEGNRVIDPRKFYAAAKEKFWECVTVGVKKAEDAIGKETVDGMSTKPKSLVASLVMK